MNRLRPKPLALVCVTLAVFVVVVTAGAAIAGSNPAAARGCSAATSMAVVAPTSTARVTAIHQYDDYIEDVVSAPDICAQNVVTNDNLGLITIGLHIHDRQSFSAGDGYGIVLDTDRNPATGTPAGPGDPGGAEYRILIQGGASQLERWNGTAFEAVATQQEITTDWLDGYGPVLELNRGDIGDAAGFDFAYVTSNGPDFDRAPDTGVWSYTLAPLELTPSRLLVGPARAGKTLLAAMEVTRSDFDIALDEGKITCAGKLSGKPLRGRGAFGADLVGCTWRLPKTASGKRVNASVAVTFQGVTAKRSLTVRVK